MQYNKILRQLPEESHEFGPCYAFSVHKSGSTMMNNMINAVCKESNIPAITLPTFFFNEGIAPKEWARDPKLMPAFTKNLLYFGFRFLPQVFEKDEFDAKTRRFVLLVRDPRDALVSQYFSYGKTGGSHKLPKKGADALIKKMAQTDDLTIDEYVIKQAPLLRGKLAAYRDTLNFDLGSVHRYEDVFFDKGSFLKTTFAHFGIPVEESVIEKVADKFDIRPDTEDQSKHIRKGTPGDHIEKLKPETIVKLNGILGNVAGFYGYDL